MSRLRSGDRVEPLRLTTIQGKTLALPDGAEGLVHLQFRRFAGCPICNLHLRALARRAPELEAAGIDEVAVFHSNAETMLPFQGDLPFAVIADPEKELYRRFGVEQSVWSVLNPCAWPAYFQGIFARHPSSTTRGEGGHLGLPADFLIGASGEVLACKYGTHANDHWSADELLALAAAAALRKSSEPSAPDVPGT